MKLPRFYCCFMVVILSAVTLLSSCSDSNRNGNAPLNLSPHSPFSSAELVSGTGTVTEEVRGVWIASVYNINFPSAPDLPCEVLEDELDEIIKTVLSHKMNTVFFQVHPASDSLYNSTLFPVSSALSSTGELYFDPLKYMSELCKENDIDLFAWINPLRVSLNPAKSEDDARNAISVDSPAKNDGYTVFYGDGKLYLNCGVKAVRDLIADTVDEILDRYDIAGVIFDDYFYPYPVMGADGKICEFDDKDTYDASNTTLSPDDWRRDNVNKLIKLCYDRVKSHGDHKKFGVAPFGIWQNNDGSNGGSDTSGMEAYSSLYCDAKAWINGGYIDFISPQIYWKTDNSTSPFGELAEFWNSITVGTDVELIISHGVYRYDNDWDDPRGELQSQINVSRHLTAYKGSVLYGYAAIADNTEGLSEDTLDAFGKEVYFYIPAKLPGDALSYSLEDFEISGMMVKFTGYSDPTKPLAVNSKQISRSYGGYFECELELIYGENNFIFSDGTNSKTVTVFKQEIKN